MSERIDELEAVARVIQRYIDGAGAANIDLLREAFHDSARMFGNEGDVHEDVPIGDFLDYVARTPVPGPSFRARIVSIDVVGDAAVAVLAEDNYQGQDYVDFFSLVKTGGLWKIVNKTYAVTGRGADPANGT